MSLLKSFILRSMQTDHEMQPSHLRTPQRYTAKLELARPYRLPVVLVADHRPQPGGVEAGPVGAPAARQNRFVAHIGIGPPS